MNSNLIIIPTYNEVLNISNLIDDIENILSGLSFSILVVDDNSSDGTIDAIEKQMQVYDNLFILKRKSKLGLASAYIEGFKYALNHGYKNIVQIDADYSHNPNNLPFMISKLNEYDLVIASRNIKGGSVLRWSVLRNLISKGGSLYSRLVLACPIYDLTGGFNAWKAETVKKINLNNIISKGFCFQIEMKYRAYKNKSKILEFPFTFQNRKLGKSKMNKRIFFEALLNILKLKFMI